MNIFSLGFVAFFIIIFLIYWFCLKERKTEQNILLLAASYLSYSFADWRMTVLLLGFTVIFYTFGLWITKTMDKKPKVSKFLTVIGFIAGIGLLFYFKYFNFFAEGLSDLFALFGFQTGWTEKKIIFPLGVSFFTFKLISYIYEVSQEKIVPEKNFISFAAYIAFFPTIAAGPIDRPQTFLPQINKIRSFNYALAVDGCRQILWGLFKKVVIADTCAVFVMQVFGEYQTQTGSTLLLAAIFRAFYVYADFSGYSDMAIGVSKLLGFRVTKNFDYPFFAQNIAEFWRKWHISLTSWLTDYVFKTLHFKWRKWGKFGIILAIIVNLVLVGLWHGANWTYVVFGLYHAMLFIILILSGAILRKNEVETYKWGFPKPRVLFKMLFTFGLVTTGMIIAGSKNIGQAFEYLGGMVQLDTFRASYRIFTQQDTKVIWFVLFMLVIEWMGRRNHHGLELFGLKWKKWVRWLFYYILVILIFASSGKAQEFIYFQF